MKSSGKICFFVHSGFWLLNTIFSLNYLQRDLAFSDAFWNSIYYSFLTAIPFYVNYFFFAGNLLIRKRYVIYTIQLSLLIFSPLIIINYTEFGWLLVDEGSHNRNVEVLINFLFFILLSNFIKGLEIWMFNSQRQIRLEKEKIQAELNFLKMQISPHFLFNTLNNVYSLSYNNDKRAAEMIAKLSKILRYIIYDCQDERVQISKEVDFIGDFTGLQLLKSDTERNIDIYTEGISAEHRIAPLILITFVENSFKHSDIEMNENGWIRIDLIIEHNILNFSISNSTSLAKKTKKEHSGIGFKNAEQQLELNYSGNYKLTTTKKQNNYTLSLELNLDT